VAANCFLPPVPYLDLDDDEYKTLTAVLQEIRKNIPQILGDVATFVAFHFIEVVTKGETDLAI